MREKMIDFSPRGGEHGALIAIEGNREIPFDIKRIFYIYGMSQNIVRGQHANRYSEFILISIAGSCKVKTFDGVKSEIYVLDTPNRGLYIPKMVWKDMYDFSSDCVLLALSDCPYVSSEYIKDITIYKRIMQDSLNEKKLQY